MRLHAYSRLPLNWYQRPSSAGTLLKAVRFESANKSKMVSTVFFQAQKNRLKGRFQYLLQKEEMVPVGGLEPPRYR